MTKQKTVYRIILAVFVAAFVFVACNNNGEGKTTGTDSTTTMKTDSTMKMDSSSMNKMDTGMNKMDTAGTRPVKPGN